MARSGNGLAGVAAFSREGASYRRSGYLTVGKNRNGSLAAISSREGSFQWRILGKQPTVAAIRSGGNHCRDGGKHGGAACRSALFLLIAGLAMYGVARRLCAQPLAATALLIASPAVLPAQNLMLDVPVLALGLVSVYFCLRGAKHRTWLAILGGAFLGLAFLTKFNALPLAPLFVIYAFVKRRRRCLIALLPALAIVGLWAMHDLAIYGVTQIASRQEAPPLLGVLSQLRVLLDRAVFTLSCLGASCFLPLFLVPRRSWQSAALVGLMIAASALPYLYALHQGRVTVIHVIVGIGLLMMGMMALVLLSEDRWIASAGRPRTSHSEATSFFLSLGLWDRRLYNPLRAFYCHSSFHPGVAPAHYPFVPRVRRNVNKSQRASHSDGLLYSDSRRRTCRRARGLPACQRLRAARQRCGTHVHHGDP